MAEDNDKYLTFLRETHRKVKLPAADHDRVILADARRLLETRNEELDRVKDTVSRLIKARKALIDAEDANLRDLYDSRIVERHVKCRVYVDARGGGMIKLVRCDNGEIFGEPRPLTKEEREAFSSTKSQTGLYDAAEPAMNEALAKKLKLTEFMADDPPVDPQQRVARVLSESALPEDLRDALLALDTEEEDPGEALREAKAAKAKEDAEEAPKKRGRPKKEKAEPPPDAEPGPEKAEKDPAPGPPKPPRKPVQDEPPEPMPEYPPQDFDGGADVPEAAADDAASEGGAGDPDVQDAEEAAGGDVPPEDEEEAEEESPVSASDFEPPPESTPAPTSAEDFADFVSEDGSEAPEDTEEPSPVAPAAEPEPPAAEPDAIPEEVPVATPVEPKKGRGKKKAEAAAEPPPEPATPPPAAPAVPAHDLTAENHFGLGEKLGVGLRSGILTCVKVTPVFSDRAVPILTAPGANNGRTVKFKDTWAAATIPILDDLATAKEVRRRDLPSGITVWWHEKHDATIDTVIAGYTRDGGTSFMAKLGKP